jgi:hypothetical protein
MSRSERRELQLKRTLYQGYSSSGELTYSAISFIFPTIFTCSCFQGIGLRAIGRKLQLIIGVIKMLLPCMDQDEVHAQSTSHLSTWENCVPEHIRQSSRGICTSVRFCRSLAHPSTAMDTSASWPHTDRYFRPNRLSKCEICFEPWFLIATQIACHHFETFICQWSLFWASDDVTLRFDVAFTSSLPGV